MISRNGEKPEDHGAETSSPDGRASSEHPRSRQDFPVDWPQDDYIARRDFMKFLVLTSAGFAAGQLWIVLQSATDGAEADVPAVPIAAIDELPVGGAKTFVYPAGSPPRILVRTGERAFVAYDQQCTHLLCPVVPAVESGRLHCPCHNGWFDLATGAPLAGPPRRPLPRITIEIRGETIYATGVEQSPT